VQSQASLTFQGFTLDRGAGTLTGPEGPMPLRPKTIALLDLLVSNAGRTLSKEELLDKVWANVTVTEDTLTQTIHELRKSLGPAGPALIRTVPRRGYLFSADPLQTTNGITLSVLPFTSLSSDREKQYFADGLTTDLEAALGLISELDVLSVSPGVAEARYRLSGTVRASDSDIRVTTRLADSVTGRALWNGRFDGKGDDIFAFQDRITRETCVALQIELTAGAFAAIWDGRTNDLRAWECMVTARRLLLRFNPADNARAADLLREALTRDPHFTGALNLLACVLWNHVRYWADADHQATLDEIEALADRAESVDSRLGSVSWMRAFVALEQGRHDDAVALLRRACTMAPADSWVQGSLGLFLVLAGEDDEALAQLHHARTLSRYRYGWMTYNIALANMWLGQLDLAAGAAEAYLQGAPEDVWAHATLATIHVLAGRTEAAEAVVARLRARFPNFALSDVRRSQNYRDPGRLAKVVTALRAAGLPD
jgi:adenylate cyclase